MNLPQAFHRQLKELWEVHPALADLKYCRDCDIKNRNILIHSGSGFSEHELADLKDRQKDKFKLNGYKFIPTACKAFSVLCAVDILFLRHGDPSGTYNSGDLDNRVKTVIDALSKPTQKNQIHSDHAKPGVGADPFFVVMEDDSLVSSLSVTSDTLLEKFENPDKEGRDAMLIISIDIRPYMPTQFNLAFS